MLTVWTCWLRLSQAAVTTRRRASRTPLAIKYAHSLVPAPTAWVRPDGTGDPAAPHAGHGGSPFSGSEDGGFTSRTRSFAYRLTSAPLSPVASRTVLAA